LLKQCGLSEACIDLVEGLLKDDPSERFTAVEACQHSWFVGQPIHAHSPSELSLNLQCGFSDPCVAFNYEGNDGHAPCVKVTPVCDEPPLNVHNNSGELSVLEAKISEDTSGHMACRRIARRGGA